MKAFIQRIVRNFVACIPSVLVGFAHAVVLTLGLSIPVTLALSTFTSEGGFSPGAWFELAGDVKRWSKLLSNTLVIGGLATAVAVVVGSVIACLAFKTRWAGRSVLVLTVIVLVCTPKYVLSTAVFAVVSLQSVFESVTAAGLIHGIMYIPLASLIIGLGLTLVRSETEHAALLDSRPWSVLLHISVPQAAWSLAAAAAIIFALVITDYSITDVISVRCFAEEIFTRYQLQPQRPTPFLLALPVMAIIAVLVALMRRSITRNATVLYQGPSPPPFLVPLQKAGHLLAWAVAALLLTCAVWAFARLVKPVFPEDGMWLEAEGWQRLHIAYKSFEPDLVRTILVSASTALACALLAPGLAWMLARSVRWRQITGVTLLGLLAIPAPALGMTLIKYFNVGTPAALLRTFESIGIRSDPLDLFYNSVAMYDLAIGLRFLPLAVLVVLPAVCRVPRTLEEAARSDGAGWLKTLWQVYLPESKGNILLAGLAIMILAIGEIDCSYLVAPPGKPTLSVRFFTFIHFGLDAQVATLCLAAMVTTLVPAVLIFGLGRRRLMGLG